MSKTLVRIGGASGAWGDSPLGLQQLVKTDVDYLMMDYLAEVTMSLLARARLKNPDAGFPPDFVGYLRPHLAELAERGIRVVSNGGGVNPQACKRALEAICAEQNLGLKIAVVEGDDLLPYIDQLRASDVREAVSGAALPATLLTANAYLGALPIAAALAEGADIVITGRCVDSALALGILMHEFGWSATDYDRLAAGSLVGHILECGPQSTGGVFTDWESVPDWHNIGYPIAECAPDGEFVLTKPEGTGGLVSTATVAEQVLYEIADPAAYFLPDVTADFSRVVLQQLGEHRVQVSGARGLAPTAQYKVSATYQAGFRAVAMIVIVGHNAVGKAQKSAHALLDRARMQFRARGIADFTSTFIEVLGAEASYGDKSQAGHAREVVLRVVAEHADAKALDSFAREVGSIGLSFAQGTAGLIGGRPKPTPVIRLFTFFVDKNAVAAPTIQVADAAPHTVAVATDGGYVAQPVQVVAAAPEADTTAAADLCEVPLLRIAHARSGDKGDSSNIAIICRKPEYLPWLRQWLTPERLVEHFGSDTVQGEVVRYDAPGVHALNFVMQQALGGGGMASQRIDPQGKAFGQRALEIVVSVPRSWGVQP